MNTMLAEAEMRRQARLWRRQRRHMSCPPDDRVKARREALWYLQHHPEVQGEHAELMSLYSTWFLSEYWNIDVNKLLPEGA